MRKPYAEQTTVSVANNRAELIKADRLCEKRGFCPDPSMPDWPMHMADKNWVDINLFVDAFERALSIHDVNHDFPPNWKERLEIWMEGRRPQEH